MGRGPSQTGLCSLVPSDNLRGMADMSQENQQYPLMTRMNQLGISIMDLMNMVNGLLAADFKKDREIHNSQTVSDWYYGRRIPRIPSRPYIAKALGCEVDDIFPPWVILAHKKKAHTDVISQSYSEPGSMTSVVEMVESGDIDRIQFAQAALVQVVSGFKEISAILERVKPGLEVLEALCVDPSSLPKPRRSPQGGGSRGYASSREVLRLPEKSLRQINRDYPNLDLRISDRSLNMTIIRCDDYMIVVEHAPERSGEFDRIIEIERIVEGGLFDSYVKDFQNYFNSAVRVGRIDDI